MESKKVILFFISIFFISCSNCSKKYELSPFETIVYFKILERNLCFSEAQVYMDVESVYSKLGYKNPIKDWKESSLAFYKIAKSKKFSNKFLYDLYDIEEIIKKNIAFVKFSSKKRDGSFYDYLYELKYRNNKWIIVNLQIKYIQ